MNFKKGKNTIKPRTLRKLTRAIYDLQNSKDEELTGDLEGQISNAQLA
jgi:hypothetical protein